MADYIGARYTIKVYQNSLVPSSAEWEGGVAYEPLILVTYNNSSYLSKVDVPASVGSPDANPTYWVETGAYNGQILNLQNQINGINAKITNGFLNLGDRFFTATGDGVKTYSDLIGEAVTSIITSLTADDYFTFSQIAIGTLIVPAKILLLETIGTITTEYFSTAWISGGNIIVDDISANSAGGTHLQSINGNITDYSNVVASVGETVSIGIKLYRRIV